MNPHMVGNCSILEPLNGRKHGSAPENLGNIISIHVFCSIAENTSVLLWYAHWWRWCYEKRISPSSHQIRLRGGRSNGPRQDVATPTQAVAGAVARGPTPPPPMQGHSISFRIQAFYLRRLKRVDALRFTIYFSKAVYIVLKGSVIDEPS
jgi:hypothetical protein